MIIPVPTVINGISGNSLFCYTNHQCDAVNQIPAMVIRAKSGAYRYSISRRIPGNASQIHKTAGCFVNQTKHIFFRLSRPPLNIHHRVIHPTSPSGHPPRGDAYTSTNLCRWRAATAGRSDAIMEIAGLLPEVTQAR
jgi:hypothetical protein